MIVFKLVVFSVGNSIYHVTVPIRMRLLAGTATASHSTAMAGAARAGPSANRSRITPCRGPNVGPAAFRCGERLSVIKIIVQKKANKIGANSYCSLSKRFGALNFDIILGFLLHALNTHLRMAQQPSAPSSPKPAPAPRPKRPRIQKGQPTPVKTPPSRTNNLVTN